MARIPRYDRQILANEVQPQRIGLAGAGAGMIANMAGTTANVAGEIAQAEHQIKQQTWLTEASVELQRRMLDEKEGLEKEFSSSPEGFSAEAEKRFRKAVGELGAGAPGRQASAAWAKIAGNLQIQGVEQWRDWEQKQKVSLYAASLDKSLLELGTLAYRQADPAQFQNLRNNVEMAMVGAEGLLAPNVIAETKQKALQSVAQNLWTGVNEKNPYQGRKMLDSKMLDGVLPPEKLASLREKSQNEIERRQREAQQQAALARAEQRDTMRDLEAALRAGMVSDVPDDALNVFDGNERKQWQERLKSAQTYGKDAQAMAYAGPDEIKALLEGRTTGLTAGGVAGFREEARDLGGLQDILQKRAQLIDNDAAGYAANSPAMRTRLQELVAAEQSGDIETIATATQGYLTALTAEQKRLGIADEQVRYIPKTQAQSLVNRYMGLNDPREKSAYLDQLETQYGRFWPSVAYHMKQEGMPAGFTVASLVSTKDPNGRKMLEATTQAPELKQALGGTFTQVNNKVKGQLSDLTATLMKQPGGLSAAAELQSGAGLLAAKLVAEGENPDNAAQTAARLIKGRYDIQDTYRIPKASMGGSPVNTSLVRRNLDNALRSLSIDGLDMPVNDQGVSEGAKNAAIKAELRNNAYWVNSADEGGFHLMWSTGQPVSKGGRPVLWRLDDLNKERPDLKPKNDAVERLKERTTVGGFG